MRLNVNKMEEVKNTDHRYNINLAGCSTELKVGRKPREKAKQALMVKPIYMVV